MSRALAIAAYLVAMMAAVHAAADLDGRVVFSGNAVPGATVTATKADRKISAVTNDLGEFHLAGIDAGTWTVRVEMRGFVQESRTVQVPPSETPLVITLTMKTLEEIAAAPAAAQASSVAPAAAEPMTTSVAEPDAASVITGSSINGGASPFAQPRAFGNNRPQGRSLYSGAVNFLLGNSALNARPYSFSDTPPPVPSYGDVRAGVVFQGPLKIPWLVSRGPMTSISFQHSQTNTAVTQSALVPTAEQRRGDFSSSSTTIRNPMTGVPFAGNVIPANLLSPAAQALLVYFPMPNVAMANGHNYESSVLARTTQDALQVNMTANVNPRNTLTMSVGLEKTSSESGSVFGFQDGSSRSNITASINWLRRVSRETSMHAKYEFTRTATATLPFFSNRIDVAAGAGVRGGDSDPVNWGPPALSFSDISGLRDVDFQRAIARAHTIGFEVLNNRGTHNITIGGDVKRSAFDQLSQQDPRGSFAFTGTATGAGLADFLVGLPNAVSIASGNADKRLRGNVYDAYANDDWRIHSGVTVNAGLRWEYEAPMAERENRLVNLAVTPDFSAATPVQSSLLRPDRLGLEPRLGVSWRPIVGSSLVLHGAYGLYRNTNVYQPLALLLAQQPPLSNTFSVQSTSEHPLTLSTGLLNGVSVGTNTVAIDPSFRVGVAENWEASVQRELPANLTVIAAYLGTRGHHLPQAFLPNTNPSGVVDPCPACPRGFMFVTSNATSLRNAMQFTLRRRLRNGFTATAQYTFSRATDNASTFSSNVTSTSLPVAQDWRHLDAERGPSSFDQPHLLSVQAQYSTGVGVAGGTLLDGFWGRLYKDWTISTQLTAGSGLPVSPIYFSTVGGTGVVGLRPSLSGAAVAPVDGAYANAAEYVAPSAGSWGDAGRNSIRGPKQFSMDASLSRVFRFTDRITLEWRIDASNVLNRVTFSAINPIVSSPQFGQPIAANAMRKIVSLVRLRF